ncbi:hypothetical protein [Kineosporia succinea]|uniref:Uncharacterized protein n=1 Tax=Kineosporia succinea TaxID=84632 RepID=A0ABT9NX70_9ACTN|nr:hypothetical protein [Kineosporia succinea]
MSEVANAGATLTTTGAKLVITNDSWSSSGFTGNFKLHDTKCDDRTIYFRVQMWSTNRLGFADWTGHYANIDCNQARDYGKRTFNVAFGSVKGMTVSVCRTGNFWQRQNCASQYYHP